MSTAVPSNYAMASYRYFLGGRGAGRGFGVGAGLGFDGVLRIWSFSIGLGGLTIDCS